MTRIPVPRDVRVWGAHVVGGTPVTPRDAATVILLRDRDDGVEVLLLCRKRAMDFAPGAHVFPGGSVDPGDADAGIEVPGDLGVPPERVRALVGAAVRETREECGVVLRADTLIPWARWITPEVSNRRFDTWFFVAAMPEDQVAGAVAEADSAQWLRPAAALDAARAGEITLLPPTAVTVAELTAFSSVTEVLAQRRVIAPLMPSVVVEGGQTWLVMPEGTEYPL
ncbi:MAG TPA: NUDIX domain-containing protein [Streptosporangiaceae bacterium]